MGEEENERGIAVAPPEVAPAKPKLEKPKMYKVVFLNDDYTPFEFVTYLITKHFNHSQQRSLELTQDIHQKGKAIVGTYSKDIAETKVLIVNSEAQEFDYPLKAVIEEE